VSTSDAEAGGVGAKVFACGSSADSSGAFDDGETSTAVAVRTRGISSVDSSSVELGAPTTRSATGNGEPTCRALGRSLASTTSERLLDAKMSEIARPIASAQLTIAAVRAVVAREGLRAAVESEVVFMVNVRVGVRTCERCGALVYVHQSEWNRHKFTFPS
jgi:hypothetical protein